MNFTIARIISLVVLIGLVVLFAILFIQIMAGFLVPVFLAVLLAVLFRPLHARLTRQFKGRDRVAAGLTTVAVLAIVLVPITLVTVRAIAEARQMWRDDQGVKLDRETLGRSVDWVNERTGLHLESAEVEQTLLETGNNVLGRVAARTPGVLGEFLLGLGIMIISLYYFLADGDQMVLSIGRMLPLEMAHQRRLVEEFGNTARAVASATLLSALAQGVLAGIAYYLAGLPSVFLLMTFTFLAAMIPFVGATIVWLPACLYLYFFEQRPLAAAMLALWSAVVVSMVDNVIKPLVLHGQSNIHPLLALLSVLGGVKALGPIGIFVGPMAVVFLQAGMAMLNAELNALRRVPVGEAQMKAAQASRKLE